MCDEPEHQSLPEIIGEQICEFCPRSSVKMRSSFTASANLRIYSRLDRWQENNRMTFPKRRQEMKGIVFIVAFVVILAVFGLPVLGCFMGCWSSAWASPSKLRCRWR